MECVKPHWGHGDGLEDVHHGAVVTQARRGGDMGQVGGGPSGVRGIWAVPPWRHGHREGTVVWGCPLRGT